LVPQKPTLTGNLRVKAVLHYAYRLKNRNWRRSGGVEQELRRIEEALRLAGFGWTNGAERERFLNQFCASLSGGEEKRLSLALELLDLPDILLLDEPNSGLDAHTDQKMFAAMQRLVTDSSVQLVLFITHNLTYLNASDWVIALGTPSPGQSPAHLSYCGPRGLPGSGHGIYGALGAGDDAGIMEKLATGGRSAAVTGEAEVTGE
jgi:ABC-type multidrug transport system ATPase subunit